MGLEFEIECSEFFTKEDFLRLVTNELGGNRSRGLISLPFLESLYWVDCRVSSELPLRRRDKPPYLFWPAAGIVIQEERSPWPQRWEALFRLLISGWRKWGGDAQLIGFDLALVGIINGELVFPVEGEQKMPSDRKAQVGRIWRESTWGGLR